MGQNKANRLRELTPAPGDLGLLQAFVNTADLEAGTDRLTSPQTAAEWLIRHRLLNPRTELTTTDFERVVSLREGLRSTIGGGAASKAAGAADRAVATSLLRLRFGPEGVYLEPTADGIDSALARLLTIVVLEQPGTPWSRLKVCDSPTCRAVFYAAKNRAARWCHPRCGNRHSVRAWRRRRGRHSY